MKYYTKLIFLLAVISTAVFLTSCVRSASAKEMPSGIVFSSQDLFPEGIAYDKTSGSIFVSSMKKGTVGTVSKNGRYTVFVDDNYVSTSGLTVDSARRRLFVALVDPGVGEKTSKATQLKVAAIAVYNIKTKERLAYIDLQKISGNVASPHFINEIVVAKDGSAYASDSFSPIIYKISSDLQKAEIFVNDASISGEGFNFNGLALAGNKKLLALKYNSGEIYSIDLKSKALKKLTLPKNAHIIGADGFVIKKNIGIIAHNAIAKNGKDGISFVKFNKAFDSVEKIYTYDKSEMTQINFEKKTYDVFSPKPLSNPTTIAPTPFGAYVLNSSLGQAFAGKHRKTFNIIAIKY